MRCPAPKAARPAALGATIDKTVARLLFEGRDKMQPGEPIVLKTMEALLQQ